MKIKALIPVRSGSVRVKNKNIRPFAGSTLLEIKINQLKHIEQFDGIIVNSNDDEMLSIATQMGCETVKRDPYYASNEVSMSDVYKNIAENFDADIMAYINVTNPLLKDKTIVNAINEFLSNMDNYDSLNSAHLIKEFMFKDNKPINYDLMHQPRSQDLPDIYALNFAVNILKRDTMIKCKNVVGNKPLIYGIDEIEATDIDNPIDFKFAEFVYSNNLLSK
ncbi:MAG TPA: cytidylyltransferase [Ruminococcaceae bacterium]|nr:cytidylyltransferase [Oscillospiraceae bacterium]